MWLKPESKWDYPWRMCKKTIGPVEESWRISGFKGPAKMSSQTWLKLLTISSTAQIKIIDSGPSLCDSISHRLCHLPSVWLWASYFTSLSLSCLRIKCTCNACKVLRIVPNKHIVLPYTYRKKTWVESLKDGENSELCPMQLRSPTS